MALLSWGYDDGQNKKDDNLFDTPPIQHIQSVQSSWQPSGSTSTVSQGGTGDSIFSQDNSSQDNSSQGSQGNYLMSAESDQADAAIAQRRAAEAQARQQAAIDAENNRRQQAAAAQVAKQQQQQQQPQTKYTPAKQGAKDEGLWGFLKGIGGVVQQGVGALGDIAVEGGGVLDYAGQRLRGIDANQAAQNTVRNTEQLRNLLHNQKDITGANIVGTQDVDQNAANIAAGRGNAQDFAAVGGKSLQAGLDATMFANPARMALGAAATRPVVEGASILSRTMANPALRYAARDAGFFGGLQGTASGAQTYGQTGDLGQSLKTAGQDALIGGLLQGTMDLGGHVVGKGVKAGYQSVVPFANKTMRGLRNPGEFRIGDKIVELVEDGSGKPTLQERPNSAPQDGNVSFEQPSEQMPPTQPDGTSVRQQPPVADGVVQPTPEMTQTPEQMTPQTPDQSPAQTPVEKAVEDVRAQEQAAKDAQAAQQAQQPQPDQPQPVADGAIQPVNPVPVDNPNMPTIKAERVKQLQDAKAGASQADEAAINQELMQTQATLPQAKAPEPVNASDPLAALKQEALKYKSADEFNNLATSHDMLHKSKLANAGMTQNEYATLHDSLKQAENDYYALSDQANAALKTAIEKSNGQPLAPAVRKQLSAMNDKSRAKLDEQKTIIDRIAAIDGKGNPRQQLTDLYNQAHAEAKVPELTPAKVPVVGGDKTGQMIPVRQPEVSAPQDVTPVKDNLPNGMGGDAPKGDVAPLDSNLPDGMNGDVKPLLTKQQIADRLITNVNHTKDVKTHLAEGLGIPLDSGLEVSDMLKTVGVEGKSAKIIEDNFKNVEKNDAIYNKTQEANRENYVNDKATPKEIDQKRNAALRDSLESLSAVMKEIRYIQRHSSVSERAVQALEGIVKYRATNILTSAGLFERNAAQEVVSTVFRTAQNPIKTITGMVGYGSATKSATKSVFRDISNVPHGITSKARHASSAVYKLGMIPTDALQQARAGMYRDEIARQALKMGGNKNPNITEIRQLSKKHGALAEAVSQMFVGVDSQIVPRKSALKAGDALMQFLRTGSDADLAAVNKAVERTGTVSDGIIKQLHATGKMNNKVGRALMSVVNGTFMFTRVATNATRNAAEIFNPFAPSLVDSIGRTNRSKAGNLALTLKSKPAAYAALAAVPAMYAAGNIGYNDGDDPSKPRGVWIKNPDGSYINSRSTGLFELPIGIMVLGSELYKDAQEGHMRDAGYYSGIVTQSLPYIDTAEQASGAITSVTDALFGGNNGTGDNGYAAKSYAVNQIKSLVPFSNNSVQPYVAGRKGIVPGLHSESLNAKTTYDKNFGKWLGQSIRSSYDPAFRDTLKDSRDNAGRVRTVDNQGVFINKTINDANTKTYNSAINDLVKYGRDNGLGNNTQDMFNTYDTGKNNNFKSVQDSLTFLDVPQGGKPDAADKLKSNSKIADLAQQIKNGFYGDTGSELLTLDGQNLKSDASVPTKDGSKNSRLPLSMQSIKNAVAATDLPKDQSDKLYALSVQSTELYNQLKAKSISYDQYSAEKNNLAQQQAAILSGSKSYQKLNSLMDKLNQSGFFDANGLGSTKSGQTYLWNSLNTLLGSKGATPAANYPTTIKSSFTPYGRRSGGGGRSGGAFTPTTVAPKSFQVTPVQARKMATVAQAKYTPLSVKIKLGNAIKKDKTQNYADRSF